MQYRVVIHHDPATGLTVAAAPDLPGVVAAARSRREALRQLAESAAAYGESFAF